MAVEKKETSGRRRAHRLIRPDAYQDDRVEDPVRGDAGRERTRGYAQAGHDDTAGEDNEERAGDRGDDEYDRQRCIHDREPRDRAVPKGERDCRPRHGRASAISRKQSAEQCAAKGKLFGYDRAKRQKERDVPSELIARDARKRRVADRLADHRRAEPEQRDTEDRDRSSGERSDRGTASGGGAAEPERLAVQPDHSSGEEGRAGQRHAGENELPAASGQHGARTDERMEEVAPKDEEDREKPDLHEAAARVLSGSRAPR